MIRILRCTRVLVLAGLSLCTATYISHAQTPPTIGTCVTAEGTGNLSQTINITTGQSVIVFHKTVTTDTPISDSQGNMWTSASGVNTASSGCQSFDYVPNPKSTGSDTVTVNGASPTANNAFTLCTVNNFAMIDVTGGAPTAANSTALSGRITPTNSGELVLGSYYLDSFPSTASQFSLPSTDIAGPGQPVDNATATNGTIDNGLATETSTAQTPAEMQRTTASQSAPSIGTCASSVGTATLTAALTNIAHGQSLAITHKGVGSEPSLGDSLNDTFTPATAVNTATSGCLNVDLVAVPNCASFPCSDTITAADPGTSLDNAITVCEVNNLAPTNSFDATGGSPYTPGVTVLTGPITPLANNDEVFANYYLETTTSFSNPSTNYIGTGTPTDIQGATLSNGTELVGAASEPGLAGNQIALERTTTVPIIPANAVMGGSTNLGITNRVTIKVLAFPGA